MEAIKLVAGEGEGHNSSSVSEGSAFEDSDLDCSLCEHEVVEEDGEREMILVPQVKMRAPMQTMNLSHYYRYPGRRVE